MKKRRTYGPTAHQIRLANRELNYILDALGVDHQWAVRRACRLIEILELPDHRTKAELFQELENRLALYRESLKFGRVWTVRQIHAAFYARAGSFRRPTPRPVTRDELEKFGTPDGPVRPAGAVPRHLRRS